jgi:hypothetical protein|tara:strand:- start:519 stop:764 length:246 start_codon:yes stop_codon:yes gene_type:complete
MNDFEIRDLYEQVQVLSEQIDGLHQVCVLMMETIDMVVVDPEPEEVETVEEAPKEVKEEVVEETPEEPKKAKKAKKSKKDE